MDRRGSVLLVALVGVLVAALAIATFHRLAVDVLRTSRGGLAATRAREAAAAGLAEVSAGQGLTGSLPGGAHWSVVVDTMATGLVLLRSTGHATVPAMAALELGGFMVARDTTAGGGTPTHALVGWIEFRHD